MNPVFPHIASLISPPPLPSCDTRLLLPHFFSQPRLSLQPTSFDSAASRPDWSSLQLPSHTSVLLTASALSATTSTPSLPPTPSASSASPASAGLDDVPPPASLSFSSPQAVADPAPAVSASSAPHSIDWHEVSLGRFCLWMSVFSIAENALFYPFYLLKTREQADRSANYNALESANRHIRAALAKGGIRGLYRGFASSSVVTLPAYGVYSGVYTWAKEWLGLTHNSPAPNSFAARHPVLISYAAPFLAGLIADVASITLYVPGDVIVQRLQLPNSPYTSFLDASRKIYQREGVAGFYRGFNATLVTSAIASAIWWLAYERSKERLYRWDEKRREAHGEVAASVQHRPGSLWAALTEVNRMPQLAAGFIAGTVTSSIINPLDVVKTRLQVQDSTHPASGGKAAKGRYRSFVHGLRQVYLEEGMRGYVRGLVPKLVSRGPLSAMSSMMYELVLYLSRNEKQDSSGQTVRKVAA